MALSPTSEGLGRESLTNRPGEGGLSGPCVQTQAGRESTHAWEASTGGASKRIKRGITGPQRLESEACDLLWGLQSFLLLTPSAAFPNLRSQVQFQRPWNFSERLHFLIPELAYPLLQFVQLSVVTECAIIFKIG